ASSLATMSDVAVTYRGRPLATLRASTGGASYESSPVAGLAGTPLHRARLSPPFGDLELAFSVNQLPSAPGALLLLWISLTLAAVLCGGFYFMYRFAIGQLRLARQQEDFVSAGSHALKTPLTSIRMYGEMLKAGWADDAKKQTYYDYIHSESERLSRLIENVLQLARLTRSSQQLDVKRVASAELLDMVRSKCVTQAERAGLALAARHEDPAGPELAVDADAFAQILINLVDNALKFSAGAERKEIEIGSRLETDGSVLFTVRDFGPGIPKGQMKKIFELFYRPPDEITRATAGTGIGLALVLQLTAALGGRVEVRNCEPGAEFRVSFPTAGPGAEIVQPSSPRRTAARCGCASVSPGPCPRRRRGPVLRHPREIDQRLLVAAFDRLLDLLVEAAARGLGERDVRVVCSRPRPLHILGERRLGRIAFRVALRKHLLQ